MSSANDSLVYRVVARLDQIEPDYPLRVQVGQYDIALFNLDGAIYATDNICTHAHASLADGLVEGDCVECPLHGACFNIRTGKALSEPATMDLRTHPVRIDDGNVLVALPG